MPRNFRLSEHVPMLAIAALFLAAFVLLSAPAAANNMGCCVYGAGSPCAFGGGGGCVTATASGCTTCQGALQGIGTEICNFNTCSTGSGCTHCANGANAGLPCESDEDCAGGACLGTLHDQNGPGTEDSDGDGSPDGLDCAPFDPTIFPAAVDDCDKFDNDCDGEIDEDCGRDSDGDGINDKIDNCPFNANEDQADSDRDAAGDVCDRSSDPEFEIPCSTGLVTGAGDSERRSCVSAADACNKAQEDAKAACQKKCQERSCPDGEICQLDEVTECTDTSVTLNNVCPDPQNNNQLTLQGWACSSSCKCKCKCV